MVRWGKIGKLSNGQIARWANGANWPWANWENYQGEQKIATGEGYCPMPITIVRPWS